MKSTDYKGKKLTYNEITKDVTYDGKVTKKFTASFVPNGDKDPDFFGWTEESSNTFINLNGKVNKVITDDEIPV